MVLELDIRKSNYSAIVQRGTRMGLMRRRSGRKWSSGCFRRQPSTCLMTKKPIDVIVPDDVVAKYSKRVCDIYDISTAIANKTLEYEKAIINQYLQYAVDEKEVTDEDETAEN